MPRPYSTSAIRDDAQTTVRSKPVALAQPHRVNPLWAINAGLVAFCVITALIMMVH